MDYLIPAVTEDVGRHLVRHGLVACGLLAKPAPGDKYPALRVLEPPRAGA